MKTNNEFHAYIDESGNFGYDFDNSGTSTHFIVTAVIVTPSMVEKLTEDMNSIRMKYFGHGEIKSSSIGNDYVKRIKILRDIGKLDFFVISYVIDKRKIWLNSGLNYKKSFLKYSNNLLHKELKRNYEFLSIHSDQHGSSEFMKEFELYFESKEMMLLSNYNFEFQDSRENVLIQLADLICGTIALGYQKDIPEKYPVFLNLFKDRVLRINHFPLEYNEYLVKPDYIQSEEYDEKIAKHCINSSLRFIKENKESEEVLELDRVSVIEYLLYQLQTDKPNRYVYSNELIKHISNVSGRKYSNHQFMTSIVAKIRDSGVILSSGSSGYKVPVNIKELYSYTNHTMQVIYPMLERLRKCRQQILMATNKDLDILDIDEYKEIKDFFDFIKRDKL